MADAPDLGSGVEKREGSSPSFRISYGTWLAGGQRPSYKRFRERFNSFTSY